MVPDYQSKYTPSPLMRSSTAFASGILLPSKRCGSALPSTNPRRHARYAPLQVIPRAEIEQQSEVESTMIPEKDALNPEAGSVVIQPSFSLAAVFMFTGGFWFYLGGGWVVAGFPVLLIGLLISVQSFRVRFVFGPEKLSVAKRKGDELEIIRGWEYGQITNWEFWWKRLPVLAYFKEKESYNGRGSVHFFPILCNGSQLLEELKKRTPHLEKPEYK